ncbi:MAG: hypothetical protein PHI66_00585 [Candidatus Pacebacteria bacterium]|nr:hypothetical protein [Candidatus Paceibacterota bacterium]
MEKKLISVNPKTNKQKKRVIGLMKKEGIEPVSLSGNLIFVVPCDFIRKIVKDVRGVGVKKTDIRLYSSVVMGGVVFSLPKKSLF